MRSTGLFSLFFMTGLAIVYITSVYLYMRSASISQRALILLLDAIIAWGTATAGNAIYWDGRLENWMYSGPNYWFEIVPRMLVGLFVLLAILFTTALVGLVHYSRNRLRTT